MTLPTMKSAKSLFGPANRTLSFVLATSLFSAGCSLVALPQAQQDPTKTYVLDVPLSDPSAPASVTTAPVVRLRAVEVPTYLKGSPLVIRRGDNEIEYREFARWGEPLEQGLARVLREELIVRGAASAVQLPGSRVADGTEARFEIVARVLNCEGASDGTIVFRARWEVVAGGEKAEVVAQGDYRVTDLKWTPKSEGTLAAALSRAAAGLADEIAAAMAKK